MHFKNMNQIHMWYPIIWICISVPANGRYTTELYPIATTESPRIVEEYPMTRYEGEIEDYVQEPIRLKEEGRGMMSEPAEEMNSDKAIKNDPWQGYYDFLINEGSFKFWAVFQVVTAAILIYSALAAVYYAKYNFIQADYDYLDWGRSESRSVRSTDDLFLGLNAQTFQRILDAISSKKYS